MRRGGVSESIEAERLFVGSLLVNPTYLPAIAIKPDDFGEPRLRTIFTTIARLDRTGIGFDLGTLKNELQATGQLAAAGGVPYVGGLVDGMPPATAEVVARWEQIIRRASKLRRVIVAAETMKGVAEQSGNGSDALDEARRILDETERNVLGTSISPGDGVREALRGLRTPAHERGLQTGIPGLDRLLGPLVAKNLLVIAARPGGGKSALAAQIAENVARRGHGVLFVSAEMSLTEIQSRRILGESGLSESRIADGRLSLAESSDLEEAVDAVASRPFYILEGTPSPTEIRVHARRVRADEHGLGLVVVDYLQLLAAQSKFQSRENAVSEMSRALKKLAGDLEVPVVAACQLNRESKKGEEREPRLEDLRESGAIEQDADLVLLLHRIASSEERINAILPKARNRKQGRTELRFRGEVFRFESSPL